MSRILWGYDESTERISPLPASPWLLPAAIILFFGWSVEKILLLYARNTRLPPENFNIYEYKRNKERYYYLLEKTDREEKLTVAELHELREKLPHPSWAKPGEYWTY